MLGRMRALTLALALVGLWGATAATPAAAADWPTRPVRLVVPFSASGLADLLARFVADKLSVALGTSFVIENRPGAGGIIGQEQVARSAPDGYTLVIVSLGSHVIGPAFAPGGFDPIKDFTHIAYLGGQPGIQFGNKNRPERNLTDVVAYAKANPGKYSYGTIATGSHAQLFNERFQKQAGIRLTHVPYRGAGQIVTDVMGGHIAAGSVALAAAAAQIKSGDVVGLGVTTAERLPEFPNVPTWKEQGYDIVTTTWFALSGPTNMPREIVDRLNVEVRRILHTPEAQARFARDAIDTKDLTSAQFTDFMKSEIATWAPYAREVAAQIKASEAK